MKWHELTIMRESIVTTALTSDLEVIVLSTDLTFYYQSDASLYGTSTLRTM